MEMITDDRDSAAVDQDVAPDAYKAVFPLHTFATAGTVDPKLLLMIQVRASQPNHCGWCPDMHTGEARKAGMPQRQLDLCGTVNVTVLTSLPPRSA